MYTDAQLSFNAVTTTANVISFTAQAETTVDDHTSTNVIDVTHIPRSIYNSLFLVIQIVVVPVSGGGGTMEFSLRASAAAALTAPTTLWSSGLVSNAVIVAYTANSLIYKVKLPPLIPLRYIGLNYEIATAVLTAGSWVAFLTPDTEFLIPATV